MRLLRGGDPCNFRPHRPEKLCAPWRFAPESVYIPLGGLLLPPDLGRWGRSTQDEHLVGQARERRKTANGRARARGRQRVRTPVSRPPPPSRSSSPTNATRTHPPGGRPRPGLRGCVACPIRVRRSVHSAEELVFVPLLFLAPLNLVPLLAARRPTADTPGLRRGAWARDRWTTSIGDSWFCIGPALVLAAFAPGEPSLDHIGIYLLALAATSLSDFAWALTRDRLLHGKPVWEVVKFCAGTNRVAAICPAWPSSSPCAAVEEPLVLLSDRPLRLAAHDLLARPQRALAPTLELHRAYRGTVMLLVRRRRVRRRLHGRALPFGRGAGARRGAGAGHGQVRGCRSSSSRRCCTTSARSRSPRRSSTSRRRSQTSEFEVMKTHTIEGQFMLDRVGGLLGRVGEIVRSCHERWDGTGYPDGLERRGHPASPPGSCSAATPTTP